MIFIFQKIKKEEAPLKDKKDKTDKTSQKSVFDYLPKEIKAESDKFIQIILDILIDSIADKLAVKAIKRLLSFIWDIPASSGHHHSQPFGLYLHSLETAVKNLRVFEERLFIKTKKSGVVDSLVTKKTRPIEQYSAFLAGLLSNLENVLLWKVTSVNQTNKEINLINAELNPEQFEILKEFIQYIQPQLEKYLLEMEQKKEKYCAFLSGILHDIGKVVKYKVESSEKTWNPFSEDLFEFTQKYPERKIISREVSYALHKKIAPLFVSKIISPSDYNYIGVENVVEIVEMFSTYSSSKYKFVTIESDMASTKESVEKSITADFAGNIIEEIKKGLMDAKYPVNALMPGVWVLELYTAVSIHIIQEAIRTVQAKKEFAGKTMEFSSLLKEWIERKYIKAENWKAVWQMEIQTTAKPFMQKVIQFANDILWAGITKPDQCKLPLVFNITN